MESNASSWLHAMGPAIPSTGAVPTAVWKDRSEASVVGPKAPSMAPGLRTVPGKSTEYCCKHVWSNRTALPWSFCLSMGSLNEHAVMD